MKYGSCRIVVVSCAVLTTFVTLRNLLTPDICGINTDEFYTKRSYQQATEINVVWTKLNSQELEIDKDRKGRKEGRLFVPGSLNLSRLESFQCCYFNPDQYQQHFSKTNKYDVSKNHKLLYVQTSKAGSSSARHGMRTLFNDTKYKVIGKKELAKDRYHSFTFTKDPYARFVSSFREYLVKMSRDPIAAVNRTTFEFARKFLALSQNERHDIMYKDLNSTVQMLETFVHEYNGKDVPDGHLRLQVPNLTPNKKQMGKEISLDAIYDVENMYEEFTKLWMASTAYNSDSVTPIFDTSTHQKQMRIDTSHLSLETRKKICQLSALDFCCLNYQLPPECEGVLSCQWIRHPDQHNQSSLSSLAITAVSPYPPLDLE